MGLAAGAAVPAVGFASSAQAASRTSAASSAASTDSSLVFDPDVYTELTTTITDTTGTAHEVDYHFYKVASYVANPVDATYQSLNVSVPVTIDGTAVDATRAPILLANQIGGYMPPSVASAPGIGAGGGMGPRGPRGPAPAAASA